MTVESTAISMSFEVDKEVVGAIKQRTEGESRKPETNTKLLNSGSRSQFLDQPDRLSWTR